MEDHGLGMLILQGTLWLWGTADILGNVVTLGPDGVRADDLLAFLFLNIPSGAVLSLWCHSLSALQLFGGCDLSPLPHHLLCVTAQINSFQMSWGHLSEP